MVISMVILYGLSTYACELWEFMRIYEIYMVTWMHFHGLIIQKHGVTTHQLRHFGPQLLYFATDRQIDSSQIECKNQSHVPNHQPVLIITCIFKSIVNHQGPDVSGKDHRHWQEIFEVVSEMKLKQWQHWQTPFSMQVQSYGCMNRNEAVWLSQTAAWGQHWTRWGC